MIKIIVYSFQGSKCCSYGAAGLTTKGYDCVMIPGAMTKATSPAALVPNQSFCGGNLVTADTLTVAKTICSESMIKNNISGWDHFQELHMGVRF